MKRIVRSLLVLLLLSAAVVTGGSLYLLSYSLTPDATMEAKNASSYKYMYAEYPFLQPWIDSLERTGALRDTVILGAEGERLHAIYAAAPEPTDRTAVIVHGYTDNAVRMLMIGYLYNHDLGCNILLPDLYYHGQSEGRAIQMGWKDRLDVLRWMEVANDIFGGDTRIVVHGISMGAATTMMVSGGLPAARRGELAVPAEIRMGFPRGFGPEAGGEMPAADAVHPRRRRRLRPYADGLSALRGQAGRKGAVGGAGRRARRLLPGQPG